MNVSSEPYRIIFKTFSGIFFIGVDKEILYFEAIASNCQKISELLYFPRGAIPPFFIFKLLSGIIFFISISLIVPRPLHLGQAPFGELKENEWGAGSS